MSNEDDIRRMKDEQSAIETRLFKLRDTVRDMEEEINNINNRHIITFTKIRNTFNKLLHKYLLCYYYSVPVTLFRNSFHSDHKL